MKRIDILPDEVLLEMFDFNMDMYPFYGIKTHAEAWQTLVHVCRRWRSLVLGSPRRLNLRLYCTPSTPAKDNLDVWPALPLIIEGIVDISTTSENIISALGQSDRVRQVDLQLSSRNLERVLAAMQVPFPELTRIQLLFLLSDDETPPVIPDSFLGGSATRLQSLQLLGIPFPGLPKLLSSATHLVYLELSNLPHSGYISPEAMVDLLSVLSRLSGFSLEFQSAYSRPSRESRGLPPLNRFILPVLNKFRFKGVTDYLEEFVTRIDIPQLDEIDITFFSRIDFDCCRLAQFINRTPTLSRAYYRAHVQFYDSVVTVTLRYQKSDSETGSGYLPIGILFEEPNMQLSAIEQVCNSSFHALTTVEDLYIEHRYWGLVLKNHDSIDETQWLRLLRPFTAVKNLYISREFALGIAADLKELIGGRITEVLPSLQNIFIRPWEPIQNYFEQFIAARRHSDHPIAISVWEKSDSDSDEQSM